MLGTAIAIWLVLSVLIGIFVWCMCVVAKQSDEDAEEWMRTHYGGKR